VLRVRGSPQCKTGRHAERITPENFKVVRLVRPYNEHAVPMIFSSDYVSQLTLKACLPRYKHGILAGGKQRH
jgi:hypothetical protein